MIYLDYSANTPVDPAVLKVYADTALHFPGNPNSAHAAGREAAGTSANEGSKAVLPEELIYTSGSSESNNLAVKGLAHAQRHKGRHIISTALEHSSLSGALTALKDQGWEIDLISTGRDGKIDLEELRSLLRKDTVLVAVSAVDSELGTKQPIREIAEILKDFPGTRLHVDATQAVGKTPLLFDGVERERCHLAVVLADNLPAAIRARCAEAGAAFRDAAVVRAEPADHAVGFSFGHEALPFQTCRTTSKR